MSIPAPKESTAAPHSPTAEPLAVFLALSCSRGHSSNA